MASGRQSRPRALASQCRRTPRKSAATLGRRGAYFRLSELIVQYNSILINRHQMHIRQAPAIHSAKITRALTMRARDTAIYRSPRRSIILALLAGIAACVSIPFLTADDMSVQIAGAVWLGLCASVLCGLLEDALQDRPIIRINGRGILDTRVLPRPIE